MIKLSSFLSFSFPERIGMICILWYALYKNGSLLLLLVEEDIIARSIVAESTV